jgi:hypothetical protein
MISVDYDVLNQKGSPAWFSDIYANIPTAGYKGRMFISTDTYAFYRDTGTGWDLIGGPGTGTITGSGATGQVSFFNGSSTLAGNNNLFWDNTNSRLGIGTITPGQALDIHSTGNTLVQLNNTSTGNSNIAFQNQNVAKWRVGNVYNAGANSFDILNATTNTTALSINNTNNYITINGIVDTGTNEIAASVYTARGDGTNAGSIYLKQRTSISGASSTYSSISASGTTLIRFGLNDGTTNRVFNFSAAGLSTTSRIYLLPDADGTIALTSNLSSYLPLAGGTLTGQLYINPTNAAITGLDVASNNTSFRSDNVEGFKRQLLITMGSGTLVKLQAQGYGGNYGTDLAFYTATTGGANATPGIYITGTNNRVGIKTGTPSYDLDISGTLGVSSAATFSSSVTTTQLITKSGNGGAALFLKDSSAVDKWEIGHISNALYFYNYTAGSESMRITSGGNIGINNTGASDTKLLIYSGGTTSATYSINASNSSGTALFYVRSDGYINVGTTTYNNATTGRTCVIESSGFLGYLVSTRESKANIQSIKSVDFINQLNPVQFNYRKKNNETNEYTDELYDNTTYGFIADEVEKVNKELVFYNDNGTLAGVEYNSIIAILTKAIQELNEKLIRNNIN